MKSLATVCKNYYFCEWMDGDGSKFDEYVFNWAVRFHYIYDQERYEYQQ